MFPYEVDAVFELIFSQKAASAAALVDHRAVEININAVLTIARRQKRTFCPC
jgi:hypothetical protein